MAEGSVAMASAVIVPEVEVSMEENASPHKRRRSSVSSHDSKRRRTSQDYGKSSRKQETQPHGSPIHRTRDQPRDGRLEERKRGQRLFGALLGTLSQSSSSTAQKRRADIEKKQRSKLQAQTEEENEKRKQKIESLTEVRREQQTKFDRQSMKIRHANLLAQAHFLQTKSEPRLFYKPWELLPPEDQSIKVQLAEARQRIDEERRESGTEDLPRPEDLSNIAHIERKAEMNSDAGRAREESNVADAMLTEAPRLYDTDKPDTESEQPHESLAAREATKEAHDDGGEVLEGEEDTVMY